MVHSRRELLESIKEYPELDVIGGMLDDKLEALIPKEGLTTVQNVELGSLYNDLKTAVLAKNSPGLPEKDLFGHLAGMEKATHQIRGEAFTDYAELCRQRTKSVWVGAGEDFIRLNNYLTNPNLRQATVPTLDPAVVKCVLMPILDRDREHWFLVAVDLVDGVIHRIDSAPPHADAKVEFNDKRILDVITDFIGHEWAQHDMTPPKLTMKFSRSPEQEDAYICGMFVLMEINLLTAYYNRPLVPRGLDIKEILRLINHDTMKMMRKRIKYDILRSALYPDESRLPRIQLKKGDKPDVSKSLVYKRLMNVVGVATQNDE